MTTAFGNIAHSIFAWAAAADYRYREACRMMELDESALNDIGITREELMAELGIVPRKRIRSRATGRQESGDLTALAVRRMAGGRI